LRARITIRVPADAKPGGYWAALTVDEVPDPLRAQPEGVGITFLTSISVGIFVYITPLDRQARILKVSILPDTASITLRNDGDCPLGVEGQFEFYRKDGHEPVATVAIPRTTVLPEPINTGLITVTLPDANALPSGRYLVKAKLDIGTDNYIGVQKEMDITRPAANPVAHAVP
jgi:hypothetical protein